MSARRREPTSGWTVLRDGWDGRRGRTLTAEGLGLIWGELPGCWDFQVTWQAEGCARAQVCCCKGRGCARQDGGGGGAVLRGFA